jgi:hypothetical protein
MIKLIAFSSISIVLAFAQSTPAQVSWSKLAVASIISMKSEA